MEHEFRESGKGGARPGLRAADRHLLLLQAKLTEIGVPPAQGDRLALRRLSELDDGAVDAVVRWLAHAAAGAEAFARLAGREAPSPEAEASAPEPAPDPRLLAW
ncbi:hypothetical protein [Streptomyces sp. HNM0574]|uniref:hypothetical protein n=1 Tax=Streptomyces sp. HNM0574 TaxID=2714954 RepID=UPI00146CEAF4|nr:hypothetical protein [Streptomyces sp. HNM0574]NLU69380.1 hypothetical protein [Streptomyces sp. HNM0574]